MITAPVDRLDDDVRRMQGYMEEASKIILGEGFPVRTEQKTYKYPYRYFDKKGNDFWNRVLSLLPKE